MKNGYTDPEVSVIIPAYNHEEFIEQAIQSVIDQHFKNWELIVIDDGSTDGTGELIDKFEDHPKIQTFHQKNRGLSATLNRGLKIARGSYFSFLPSDDYLHPLKLSSQIEVIHDRPDLDVVFCDQIPVDRYGNPSEDDSIISWTDVSYVTEEEIFPRLFERNFMPAPSALIRTDCLHQLGGFDETLIYTQDYDVWMRLLPYHSAYWLHKALLYYRWHGGNLTFSADEPIHFEKAYVITKALASLEIQDIFPRLRNTSPEKRGPETARCYLLLAESLINSGLLELLPWGKLFIGRASDMDPTISIPRVISEKLQRRLSFMDLRDYRLEQLARDLGVMRGELNRYQAEVGDLSDYRRAVADLDRYRKEVPDLINEQKNLGKKEQHLDQWNRSLDEKLDWLQGYEANVQAREQRVNRVLNQFPISWARGVYRLLMSAPRRTLSLSYHLWHILPLSVRSRFGPWLKSKLARTIQHSSAPSYNISDNRDSTKPGLKDLPVRKKASIKELCYRQITDKSPPVTVVLPIYNHASSARLSIESVLHQTYPNVQLIIVNDGSTDGVERYLAPYVGRPDVMVLSQPNQKLPRALTNGFRFASGHFYTWTSADNIMLPAQIETLVDFLIRHPRVDMVYSNVELIDENGNPLLDSDYRTHNQLLSETNLLSLPSEVATLGTMADNFINASFLYRSDVGKALGPYDPRMVGTEDYDYWLRVNELFEISKLDSEQVLYQYRVHSNTLSERYGVSHIYENVQKLVADHNSRKNFYHRKFVVLMLCEKPITESSGLDFRLATGFQEKAREFYVIISKSANSGQQTDLPHLCIDNMDQLRRVQDLKYILWVKDRELMGPVRSYLEGMKCWTILVYDEEQSLPALRDDFYGAQRFVSWERHGNKLDPLVDERTLCLTPPLLPAPILRKARDNRFQIWQFQWHGEAVVVYWGPFENLDMELIHKAAKHFDKWDFVFASPPDLDGGKIPGSFKFENIHVLGARDAEHIYPLLSSTSCVWIPVLPTGSSDLSGHYETALAAGLPFVLPRNSVHRYDAPYSYCFDSVDEAIEQLARAVETEIDLAVVDAYMKKYSPTGVADYIMAAANNDLFIERDCGRESFDADLPKPMQLSENRPCIALEINSMDKGGMEEVVCNLATQFDHLQAKPVIVCAEKGGLLAESAVKSGVRLEIMHNDIDSYEHFLREQSVALINAHYSDFGLGIASRLNIPVVSTIHNSYVWFGKEDRKRFKSADPGITHYIAVSNNVSQYMVERLEISQEKISVIPNGVDTVRLSLLGRTHPRITRDTFGFDAHDFVFLNVASLDGRKNHHAIISAVKRMISDYPNIKVICAGNIMESLYSKEIKERVERLGLSDRILFPGYIKEVVDLYRLSDAFLLPSIVEGWSIAMTEALFFGLPLILTDVGGAKEVLEKPGIGLLVSNSFGEITSLTNENLGIYTREESPSNLEELMQAMEDVLTRPEYWQGFSRKRRQLVEERYSLEIAVNRTMDVFRQFL